MNYSALSPELIRLRRIYHEIHRHENRNKKKILVSDAQFALRHLRSLRETDEICSSRHCHEAGTRAVDTGDLRNQIMGPAKLPRFCRNCLINYFFGVYF